MFGIMLYRLLNKGYRKFMNPRNVKRLERYLRNREKYITEQYRREMKNIREQKEILGSYKNISDNHIASAQASKNNNKKNHQKNELHKVPNEDPNEENFENVWSNQ